MIEIFYWGFVAVIVTHSIEKMLKHWLKHEKHKLLKAENVRLKSEIKLLKLK